MHLPPCRWRFTEMHHPGTITDNGINAINVEGSPLLVTTGSILIYKESVTCQQWIAIIVGFCFVLLIILPPASEGSAADSSSAPPAAAAVASIIASGGSASSSSSLNSLSSSSSSSSLDSHLVQLEAPATAAKRADDPAMAWYAVVGAIGMSVRDLSTRGLKNNCSSLQMSAYGYLSVL